MWDKVSKVSRSKGGQELMVGQLLRIYENDPGFVCAYVLDQTGEISTKMTMSQWLHRASLLSVALARLGIQKGDRVILSLPTSLEFVVSFLALWWIGAVPVPLPEPSPRIKRGNFHERLIHVIADCAPKAMIVPNGGRDLFFEIEALATQLTQISVMEWSQLESPLDSLDATFLYSKLMPSVAQEATDVAFIQYTSGSTGVPKGVVVTHGSIQANALAMGQASKMSDQDRILTWMPLFHDMGLVGGVLFPSFFKTPFYLMPTNHFLGNPKIWLHAISAHRITISTSPNFVYHLCAKRINPKDIPGLNLGSWRLAYNGAEPINVETLAQFTEKFNPYGFKENTFFPVYGMAEATLAISFPEPGANLTIDQVDRRKLESGQAETFMGTTASDPNRISYVSVGRALPDHEIRIRDKEGRVLGERQVGEICFLGPSVCPGYFRDRAWQKDPVTELKTGDLGYIANGNLYIVDRIKDLILIAGANYYPSDIEREIHRISGIRAGRTVAFGINEERTGTNALVVMAEISKDADEAQITREIKTRLYNTHGLVPRDIILSKQRAIPVTSSGKIMRRRCHELYLASQALATAGLKKVPA